jgi:hypothetical protein
MLIPDVFFGSARDVSRRVTPLVRRVERGSPVDVADFGTLLDPTKVSGLLIFEGGWAENEERHFHVYAFIDRLVRAHNEGRISRGAMAHYLEWSLVDSWRLLGILHGYLIRVESYQLTDLEWRRKVLAAAHRHWDELESVGPRYSCDGIMFGEYFSQSLTVVSEMLAVEGLIRDSFAFTVPDKMRELLSTAVKNAGSSGVDG